jgi:probable HAF family extracellular repeat protein
MYWTQSQGVVRLRDSSGNIYPGLANAVSGDGSIIVGDNLGIGGGAFRWANGTAATIPQVGGNGSGNGSANSVSADGTIIAGDIPVTGGSTPYVLTGTTLKMILPPGDYSNPGIPGSIPFIGTTMSANGAVVAGNPGGGITGLSGTWQWKNGTLIQFPDNIASDATAVSPDGSVVVGSTVSNGAGGNTQAFEWNNGVVTPLTWPAGYVTGSATAVSTDGTTIVGQMSPPPGGGGGGGNTSYRAFIWNQAIGVQDLQQVLTADGLGPSLSGWTLIAATAITPDGKTIVGIGLGPVEEEGWIATLDAPAPTLQTITVTPASPSIPVGATQQFTAIGSFSDSSTENITNQVTWASATPSVATISATGLASALATGTSSITASLSGVTGAAMLTVTPAPILQSITVTPANTTVTVGATQPFIAVGSFSDNSTENITSQVTWTSATPSVASISAMGLASALATGTTSITAKLNGVIGATVLTVTPAPVLLSITVTPPSPTVTVGASQPFTAVGSFSDNSTENITSQVTWTSTTPSVASISTTGLATALANGTSSITASLSGVRGAAMLTVTSTPPFLRHSRTVLTATPRSLIVGQSITLSVSVSRVGPRGSIAAGTVSFSEGNTSLGTYLLRRGKYVLRTKAISPGTQVFHAVYNGNIALLPSASNQAIVRVIQPKPKRKRG